MIFFPYVGQSIVFLLVLGVLLYYLSEYNFSFRGFIPLFLILVLFFFGYGLRLSSSKPVIDFGYFMTDLSFLLTYMIFAASLILGQRKYWKLA